MNDLQEQVARFVEALAEMQVQALRNQAPNMNTQAELQDSITNIVRIAVIKELGGQPS